MIAFDDDDDDEVAVVGGVVVVVGLFCWWWCLFGFCCCSSPQYDLLFFYLYPHCYSFPPTLVIDLVLGLSPPLLYVGAGGFIAHYDELGVICFDPLSVLPEFFIFIFYFPFVGGGWFLLDVWFFSLFSSFFKKNLTPFVDACWTLAVVTFSIAVGRGGDGRGEGLGDEDGLGRTGLGGRRWARE